MRPRPRLQPVSRRLGADAARTDRWGTAGGGQPAAVRRHRGGLRGGRPDRRNRRSDHRIGPRRPRLRPGLRPDRILRCHPCCPAPARTRVVADRDGPRVAHRYRSDRRPRRPGCDGQGAGCGPVVPADRPGARLRGPGQPGRRCGGVRILPDRGVGGRHRPGLHGAPRLGRSGGGRLRRWPGHVGDDGALVDPERTHRASHRRPVDGGGGPSGLVLRVGDGAELCRGQCLEHRRRGVGRRRGRQPGRFRSHRPAG